MAEARYSDQRKLGKNEKKTKQDRLQWVVKPFGSGLGGGVKDGQEKKAAGGQRPSKKKLAVAMWR